MPFMLQVMKDGHHRAIARDGGGEAGIEQKVEPVFLNRKRKHRLFPDDSRRAKGSA